MTTLIEKQQRMKARQRRRPFSPRKEFDLADTQSKLRMFYMLQRGVSISRVAAQEGCNVEWLRWWVRFGCPLDY
jgi:transposase-like protein